jgi:hypothetical protein
MSIVCVKELCTANTYHPIEQKAHMLVDTDIYMLVAAGHCTTSDIPAPSRSFLLHMWQKETRRFAVHGYLTV